MTILAVVAIAIATVVYGSLLEWFVHRFVFHRWFAAKHAGHHTEFHGEQFQRPGPYRNLQVWWLEVLAVALHAPLFMVLARWLGAAVGIGGMIALAAYAAATNFLHTAIHCPNGRWIERTPWYRRLVERHREHHRHVRVNFSVATQIADRITRTYCPEGSARDRSGMQARSSARRS